jgi:hypothetical protein
MDRRQVLVGMTAMGVAGSLNLDNLLNAQCTEPASKSTIPTASIRYAHLSNGEQRALLGPIKMCVEESTSVSETRVWTTEFGPDRNLLSVRLGKDGHSRQIYPRSDDVYPEVRDPQGRILRHRNRNREGAIQETSLRLRQGWETAIHLKRPEQGSDCVPLSGRRLQNICQDL